jgi:hypothetical protein
MIDPTNSIPVITSVVQNTPALMSNASVLPALIGGILVHAYHIIVNGGGLKRLGSNLWNGAVADLPPVAK